MKLLKLIGHLFWKNIKGYILLSIELIITSIVFLALIGKMQYGYDSKEIAYTFQDSNAFYFVPHMFFAEKEKAIGDVLKKECDFEYQLGEVYNIIVSNETGEIITAYGYNDAIIDCVDLDIKKGTWFRDGIDTEIGKEYIPVISMDPQYTVGEIITISNDTSSVEEKAYVIGEIDKNSYVLTFITGASRDFAKLSDFISQSNAQLIIPVESSNYRTFNELNVANQSKQLGTIIIAKDDDIHNQIYEICNDYGSVSNISVMKENYRKDMNDFYITNGIVLLIFTLLTLVGIGGFNGIQSLLNERTYTIYYMLGLSRKKCMLIELMKTIFLIIINYVIIVILYFWKIQHFFDASSYKITWLTFVIIFIYLLSICLLTSVGYVYQLGKKNLIQVYKKKA